MPGSIHKVESVGSVVPSRLKEQWDEMACSQSFYQSSSWVQFQGSIESSGSQTILCGFDDRNVLVAGICLLEVDRPSSGNYDPQNLFNDVSRTKEPGNVILGGSRGFNSGVLAKDSLVRSEFVSKINSEVLPSIGYQSSWWMYVGSELAAELAERYGVIPRLMHGDCSIDVDGESFEAYLGSLKKSHRLRVRQDISNVDRAGLSFERGRLSDHIPTCARLLAGNQMKYGVDVTETGIASWLSKMAKSTSDSGVVYICHNESGDIVGFSLVYDLGATSYVRAVGFDYELAPHRGEYFSLTCYEPIKDLVIRGGKSLHLGAGSYPSKYRRGASIDLLWVIPTSVSSWNDSASRGYNRRALDVISGEIPIESIRMPPVVGDWFGA